MACTFLTLTAQHVGTAFPPRVGCMSFHVIIASPAFTSHVRKHCIDLFALPVIRCHLYLIKGSVHPQVSGGPEGRAPPEFDSSDFVAHALL